jgi:hypothetical protein
MRALCFAMLLAWPLPGGGRIASIAYAKLFNLPTLEVLAIALITFACTNVLTACLIKSVRHNRAAKLRSKVIEAKTTRKIQRHAWFHWLLSRLKTAEEHYTSGQHSHKILLMQLPWCPGGLFSSMGLIFRWKLSLWQALPIVLISGWLSFVAYYFAASLSIYILGAVLIGPFLLKQVRRFNAGRTYN